MRGLHAIFTNMFAGQGLVRAAAATTPGMVIPTAPGPGDVFKQGGDCTLSWTPDPSGTWKQTDVELMTGDNFNMVFITTITSFDGTDASKTTFSYPCPEVTPNSAIYFYQFSSPAVPDRQWTTRFTIADASGATTPPTNATQPGGAAIPWGTGALADPSKVVAAPSYLGIPSAPGASGSGTVSVTASVTANSTASASASASASSGSGAASMTASVGSSSVVTTTQGSTTTAAITQTSTVSTVPAAPTSSSAGNGTSGSGQNGAVGVRARLGPAVLALVLAAVGFAVAF
ncbi:uncharacterized protein TRAVEDRAFT_47544 [Trametes versicolor FP-101664 SS1]|uniref:uncharacterized protein n=1 Tax=Trametes versicolor (strain FP-101664) TaxID=717944 RepID=UPI0004623856|nr:uncharacterized protein TRAVEDRAFT_47544 [Trametes versicolor FP-101664 SS1]EIW58390.1 hypothetical protein TRAVEDRAFT_47544 [Trametes versicolor FP-101664 SS1]